MARFKNKIKIDRTITRENCLIHKPFCERCKKYGHGWAIATVVIENNNKYYSVCGKCSEVIRDEDTNRERNVS
jgi:hypothetical protein